MWEYEIKEISFEYEDSYHITWEMDKLGADGWEIFSVKEKTIQSTFSEIVEYKLYMKRLIKKYEW